MVEVEDNPNWLWFVQLLKKDLDLDDGEAITIISNKHQVCSSFLYVYIKTSLVYLALIVHLYRECKTRSWNPHSNQTAAYLTISTRFDSFTSNFECNMFLSSYHSFEVYSITLKNQNQVRQIDIS